MLKITLVIVDNGIKAFEAFAAVTPNTNDDVFAKALRITLDWVEEWMATGTADTTTLGKRLQESCGIK